MSSVHCVVVWEFQCGDQWVPHTPGVTRTLERAHAKKLTRVVLADADPALKGHHVNLRTLTQCQDMPDGGSTSCLVRRACYSVQSVGGRGARWEWAPFCAPPRTAELHYEPMPMEAQCMVEEAWAGGREVVSWCGWALGARAGLARRGARGGDVRLLRRHAQPPYPLTRTSPQPQGVPGRASIPQQHTGSSVHSVQSTLSGHSVHSIQSARSARSPPPPPPPPPRSASPRDRKPNLARQILHNLNIFSSNKHAAAGVESPPPEMEVGMRSSPPPTDTECSSTRSARRHSVDTISTYLSHESKDSLQRGSVGELLNCSGGSDDVFEPPQPADVFEPPQPADVADDEVVDLCGLGVGVRSCSWARHVSCPQWGAVCPVCMRALAAHGPPGEPRAPPGEARVVALAPCQHMLHLPCLADQLRTAVDRASHTEEGVYVYIECLVCGRAYSAERARPPARGPAPGPALGPAPAQPPGSMAWRLQAVALPQCTAHNSILVTYNFQSGMQGATDPAPGSPYYAVGFPRHSVLPDDERGHQVLVVLRACWSRGVLFSVERSRTTGREHVVCWRAHHPPPSHPHHYLPPATPHSMLAHLLHDLHQLLNEGAH